MAPPASSIQVDPFYLRKVEEPRRIDPAVPGLNDSVLDAILKVFSTYEGANRERPFRGKCLLVASPEPGFGKSHLIGRLFRSLKERATLVNIKPFQTEDFYWGKLLSRILGELRYPDSSDSEFCPPGTPSQLDAFVHGVLAHLIANLLERGIYVHEDTKSAVEYLTKNPLQAFGLAQTDNVWRNWIREGFESMLPHLDESLASFGMRLASSNEAWLRVLYSYAFRPEDYKVRNATLDWLEGEPLDPEEAKSLGVSLRKLPAPETSVADRNDLAKERIIDLCQLARFYRPFLFCFDQTEIYGDSPALAAKFGLVISELANQAPNHTTVITANLDPWQKNISPHWQTAYRDRIEKPYLTLQGITIDQAKVMAMQRLESLNVEASDRSSFMDEQWLGSLFPAGTRRGARLFLENCQDRWSQFTKEKTPPAKETLKEAFKAVSNELETQPRRLQYDSDVYLWIVSELAKGLPDLKVENYRDSKGYFRTQWTRGKRRVVFGFEGGTHHRRWEAIARQSKLILASEREFKIKTLFFRTPELAAVPAKTWRCAPDIEQARKKHLHLWVLDKGQTVFLNAAYKLYLDVVAGDKDFDKQEVFAFLQSKLTKCADKFLEPIDQDGDSGSAPKEVSEEEITVVREIVKRAKFLSIKDLEKKLSGKLTRPQIFLACGYISQIKVYPGPDPNITMLQWQSIKST